jgi:para-nitrobenzyl esterase
MLLRTILVPVLSAAAILLHAQSDCANGRYTDPLFADSVTVTSGVLFGANIGVNGQPQDLYLDVYTPAGDTATDRAVVIVAFGGSFVAGTRQDVAELCENFARRGFVAVAPDYRVGFFFPSEATTTRAVVRSMHDLKACVRFLRKSVVLDGDPYGIDPDRIIVGGVSAGAIGAIHATYLDASSEIPAILYGDTASIGGVEGLSGNPGYSSDVLACYSFSGAIGDTSWIATGDQPLCSVHEEGDQVVPYGTQMVSVLGIPTGLTASGSNDIHLRCANVAVPNCFLSYPGNGHVGYLTDDVQVSFGLVADFCADMACGLDPSCGVLFAGIGSPEAPAMLPLYPNPSNGMVNVTVDHPQDVLVLALDGRIMRSVRATGGPFPLDLTDLPDGIYIVRTTDGSSARLVIGGR